MPYVMQWSEDCKHFRELLMLDPEPRDIYHCPEYRLYEICIPLDNKPIRPYRIQSLMDIS